MRRAQLNLSTPPAGFRSNLSVIYSVVCRPCHLPHYRFCIHHSPGCRPLSGVEYSFTCQGQGACHLTCTFRARKRCLSAPIHVHKRLPCPSASPPSPRRWLQLCAAPVLGQLQPELDDHRPLVRRHLRPLQALHRHGPLRCGAHCCCSLHVVITTCTQHKHNKCRCWVSDCASCAFFQTCLWFSCVCFSTCCP